MKVNHKFLANDKIKGVLLRKDWNVRYQPPVSGKQDDGPG